MPTYDWPLIQRRSGDSIENLIATLLRKEFSDARQVNPSKGDGGIDIIRETKEGTEVWQVKGFTSPLNSSQFNQVKKSWKRFCKTHVKDDALILGYHLVTPWTPTEERLKDFRELVYGAGFPCTWEGDAFISGLADDYPATMQRFVHGEGVFDQFVNAKAMLASSPVERGDSLSMLEAIEARQSALDELRDTISDNYRIEHGTRTVRDGSEFPFPAVDDPAVMHRMTYLGESRWKYESLVPKSPDSLAVEPIQVSIEFLDPPGSEAYEAVQSWSEWGIPFKDVRAKITTSGGPYAGTDAEESAISFVAIEQTALPPLYLKCVDQNDQVRFRLPLNVHERTMGANTGWLRLAASTPAGTLELEMRFKGAEDLDFKAQPGQTDGLNPEQYVRELNTISEIAIGDRVSVEMADGSYIVRMHTVTLPEALEKLYRPVAEGLIVLQSFTSFPLLLPDMAAITLRQMNYFRKLVSIYSGTPYYWTWERNEVQIPENPVDAEGLKAQLAQIAAQQYLLVATESPVFELGNREYGIDHPIANTRKTVRLAPGTDLDSAQPGDTLVLTPGDDAGVVTAKIADWEPGAELGHSTQS